MSGGTLYYFLDFIEDSGYYNGITGGMISISSMVWGMVHWTSLMPIFFAVGLILLLIGLGFIGLAEFTKLLLQDKESNDFGDTFDTFDYSENQNCNTQDDGRVSDCCFLSEASRLDLQGDVS